MLDISTKEWSRVGSLNQGRWGHAVVVRSNDFVIVGGCPRSGCTASVTTERCEMQPIDSNDPNDQMICVAVQPELTSFSRYAEAMLVDENFCVNN